MFKIVIFVLSIFTAMGCKTGIAGGFSYGTDKTVVGCMRHHTIAPKETLLDIARHFGLGFNEIQLLYPEMDPQIPDIALTSRPDGSEPSQKTELEFLVDLLKEYRTNPTKFLKN